MRALTKFNTYPGLEGMVLKHEYFIQDPNQFKGVDNNVERHYANNSHGLTQRNFLGGYTLPSGNQLHLHGKNLNEISHGHFEDRHNNEIPNTGLTAYEAAMAEMNARNAGFKPFGAFAEDKFNPVNDLMRRVDEIRNKSAMNRAYGYQGRED